MNFEKNFFKPKDAKNEVNKEKEEEKNKISEKEKKNFLSKTAKVAALLALFALPEKMQANNLENDNEINKEKIEETRININNLSEQIKEKDERERSLNGVKIKEASFSNEKSIMVAEDGEYLIFNKENGEKVYYDKDSDGVLDRVVINKSKIEEDKLQTETENRKFDNNFYFFNSLDNLEKEAEVSSIIKKKDITVVDLDHKNKSIKMINYLDGSSNEVTDEKGKEVIKSLQNSYQSEIEEISQEIE
jgi:hypothetical protein